MMNTTTSSSSSASASAHHAHQRVFHQHYQAPLPARIVLAAIAVWQRHGGGARLLGATCNFTPSCSAYTHCCIERFGLRRGLTLGWARLRRCTDREAVGTRTDEPPRAARPHA